MVLIEQQEQADIRTKVELYLGVLIGLNTYKKKFSHVRDARRAGGSDVGHVLTLGHYYFEVKQDGSLTRKIGGGPTEEVELSDLNFHEVISKARKVFEPL